MDKSRAWVSRECRLALGPSGLEGLPGAAWLDLRQPTKTPHGSTMVAPPGAKWCEKCKEWVRPELGKCRACGEVPDGPPEGY